MGGDSLPFREGVFEQEGGEHMLFKIWSSPPPPPPTPGGGGESWGDNLGGQISSIFVMGSSPPQAENFDDFGSLKIRLQRGNAKGKPAAAGKFWRF